MSKKFKHLNLSPHWQQYFSKYPDGYTIIENLIDWVSQVDDMVDNQNAMNDTVNTFGDRLDEFIEQYDTHLQETVGQTLNDWQDSGFLNIVINEVLETKYHEMDDRLTTQMEQTELFNSDLGVSASAAGVRGNGVDDDTVGLQQLINTSGEKTILLKTDGVYNISDTISLQNGTKIRGDNTKVIINADVDGFLIPKDAIVDGITFISGITGYSKIMARLDDKSGYNVRNQGYVANLNFIGDTAESGVGFGAYDDNEHGVVTFHKGRNLTFDRLKYAIYFKNSGSSWYNGNTYSSVTMYDVGHFITLDGQCDGNIINDVHTQPSGNTEVGIYCSGNGNKFDLVAWDYVAFPDVIQYDFEKGSYNEININNHIYNRNHHGRRSINPTNRVNGITNDGIVLPKINSESTSVLSRSGSNLHVYKNYVGNQDDILTMFDKRGTIEVTGKQATSGVSSNLFRTNPYFMTWTDLQPGEDVSIRLTKNESEPFRRIDVIGAIFTGAFPDYVHINVTDLNGTVSTFSVEQLNDTVVYRSDLVANQSEVEIRFGVYETKTVRLSRIFGSSRYEQQTTFIQTDGGTMYDNLVFEEGGVVLSSPNGSKYRLTINDDGELNTASI